MGWLMWGAISVDLLMVTAVLDKISKIYRMFRIYLDNPENLVSSV